MSKTYASCDFGVNYMRNCRIDVIARGIERCMNSLDIPLKVVGTLLPELHKFDIRFENEDQEYLASSVSMDLDYLIKDKRMDEDKFEIFTAGAGGGEFYIINSATDLIAKGIERCLQQFYDFSEKKSKLNLTPFKGLKNITVTAQKYFDIKYHSSHKDRFMIEFNTGESIARKENKEDTLKNIYWKHTIKEN